MLLLPGFLVARCLILWACHDPNMEMAQWMFLLLHVTLVMPALKLQLVDTCACAQ